MGESKEFWTAEEMAAQLGVTVKTLAAMRARGDGPPWLYLGRRVRYSVAAVRRWAVTTSARSTRGGRHD